MLLLECTKAELFPQMVLFEHQIYVLWLLNFLNCSIDEGKKKTKKPTTINLVHFLVWKTKRRQNDLQTMIAPLLFLPPPSPNNYSTWLYILLHYFIWSYGCRIIWIILHWYVVSITQYKNIQKMLVINSRGPNIIHIDHNVLNRITNNQKLQ